MVGFLMLALGTAVMTVVVLTGLLIMILLALAAALDGQKRIDQRVRRVEDDVRALPRRVEERVEARP
jgi:hypothetical protein